MDDFSNDEFRRQLRAADAHNTEAVKSFRQILRRYFDGENRQLSTEAKAEILGVPAPGRRNFFRVGGVGLAGAVLLAACGSDDEDETGTPQSGAPTESTEGTGTEEPTETTEEEATEDGNMDVVLARGAAATELAAVAAYDAAVATGLVTTQAVVDAALLFQDHHQQHADALNSIVTGAGGEAISEPLPAVVELLEQETPNLTDELAIVNFARTLEDAAASTYVFGASVLSAPELRQAIMTIGGAEARHVAALDMALATLGAGGGPSAIFADGAFYSTERALPAEALTALG